MRDEERDLRLLVDDAAHVVLQGWDFSCLTGRAVSQPLPWDYVRLAREAARRAHRVLDVDTGGGEVFAAIGPPRGSIAVEPYPPNVAVASAALSPLDVEVRKRVGRLLPLANGEVDVVLNRHGALDFHETARVLQSGGTFISQQVGSHNDAEINKALRLPVNDSDALTSAEAATAAAAEAGFDVERCEEAWPTTDYLDIGALVLQLRAVPWQVPSFNPTNDFEQLRRIHHQIRQHGSFTVTSHRLLLVARRR